MFNFLANPARFSRLSSKMKPWVGCLTLCFLLSGLWFALLSSPADYQQGDTVRIMYVHVPCAWMAMFAFLFLSTFSIIGLIWRHPLAHVIAQSAAPIGACFTLLCLITGSLWGKPMWGTWWAWDARLTSVLILFFLYLGVITLHKAFDDPIRCEKSAAILAIFGLINLPIIKFSVDWWNTLHQPASVIRMSGPSIHFSMLTPLFLIAVSFICFFFYVLLIRIESILASKRLEALHRQGRGRAQ